ncbi:Piso0_002896 [Millerozyma farinosa CBS 7064]|uniref:Piso0_002896 protein n=1 Tax=Pichia sorbitophila (strain ATCC MYA-4447 / BCRC 22081 / CBS 7064 / NBRC 10061 / NRRL Y-12695) TaxID=559304 RepID=G8YGL8_PICSO|nr:Piso0_002896 [Millerozyma farinosa CBS 7064]CCE80570.1 Piso0_002896 [Millerozyma farinosa CBS 7064]
MEVVYRESFVGKLLFRYKRKLESETLDGSFAANSTTSSTTKNWDQKGKTKIIIDWNGVSDPANPQNWPFLAKLLVTFELSLLQIAVYMCTAIYTPGVDQIMEEFQIGHTLSMLPLTTFVIGYGIGTMFFSPLSEDPRIGRTNVYIVTLFFYVVLQIPIALSRNISQLSGLRFAAGVFASTPLAVIGASFSDIFDFKYMPLSMGIWGIVSFAGPSMGPFFGSILVVKGGWRWAFWFTLILSGICFFVLILFLPETNGDAILYQKYKCIKARYEYQDFDIKCSAFHVLPRSFDEAITEIIWRPIIITLEEPVVLLINLYTSLVYAVLYLWFELFPIVYLEVHHFSLIQMGATYLSFVCGVVLGVIPYLYYLYINYTQKFIRKEEVYPEVFIPTSIAGNILMTAGIFLVGWTSSPKIHWFVPLIGAALFGASEVINFQSLLNYLGMSFPRYMASAFASNNLIRSSVGGVFPLFGRNLYKNLSTREFPVGWGSSVLGFISLLMCSIPILFYANGKKLRAASRYSGL